MKEHFKECGEVKRVTIPIDKATQQPKGYSTIFNQNLFIHYFDSHAFIEFMTIEGAMKAKRLTDSLFKGR